MKLLKMAFLVMMAVALMLSAPVLSGCRPGDEDIDEILVGASPFMGEWKMTRVSIEPEIPVPDFILGMFLSGSPTWKISGPTTGRPDKVRFDGRETWFNIPRIGLEDLFITLNPQQAGESEIDVLSVYGGGKISISKVSLIPGREFNDVVVNYEDSILFEYYKISNEKINASIRVSVKGGSYTVDGETKPITPYHASVKYTGVRKNNPD